MTPKEKSKLKQIFSDIKNKICSSSLYGTHLIIFFLIVFIIKIGIVYFSNKNLNPIKSCISSISSDIIVLFVAQFIITINFFIKTRILRLLNNVIVFIILLIYCVDVFTIYFFQSRVSIKEAYIMGSNGTSGFSTVAIICILLFIIIGIISITLANFVEGEGKRTKKNMILILSIVSLFYADFFGALLIFNADIYYLENIFSLNLNGIGGVEDTPYNQLEYRDYIHTVKGDGEGLNVVLVFAESLSAIDSLNMGGNDNIPNFDKIQKDGITFTNFIANGKTSDTAHIATLYGIIPLVNIGTDSTPYTGYRLLMEPLPIYLNNQGYRTTFISSASLNFLNQMEFLSGAGFQKIIGDEEFKDNKKYTFNSAPDGDLYDRTLEEIKVQTGKFFIGLQTISFHTPYNTPYGKTEALALRYSDEELYNFYQSLQKIGFFDNGILIIVGDHRKLKPAENKENELFGPNWYTRSVATVVGSGIQAGSLNSEIIQHTDFYNSLKKMLGSGDVEIDKTYNDVFSEETNRKRGITSVRYFEDKNKYTASILGESGFTFSNVSNLDKIANGEIYNYMSSYINYEIGESSNSKSNKTSLIGHRGLHDEAPENSLESFLTARGKGANGIEFDVSYTKDKQNIVAHGEYLYDSSCKNLKIKNYKYDWIKEHCILKNGEKYRTLQDMLEIVDGLFDYYFLEIKVYNESLGAQQAKEAIQTVKDLNMQDRVIFITYSNSAREVLNADQDIIFGWDTFDVNDLDFIGENNSKYFLAPYDIMTPDIVQKAKSLGKDVVTYTVNDTKIYQSMKDLGINIIMTDNLNLLQEYEKYYPLKHTFKTINLKNLQEILEDFSIRE